MTILKEFELVSQLDRENFFKRIEKYIDEDTSLDKIKEYIKKEAENIFEISNNEKLIYTTFSILINYGIKDIDFSKISETTLKVILKVENRNISVDGKVYNLKNKQLHTLKFNLFNDFLKKNPKGKINSSNKIIDLSTSIIHIDNLIKLYDVYDFTYIDCIVISNNVFKIFKNDKYKFTLSSITSLYIFGNEKDMNHIDFNNTITSLDTKIRFYIGNLQLESNIPTTFENLQLLANDIYTKILSNGSINSRNIIFYLKLKNHIPTHPKNSKNRNFIPSKLEN